MKKVIDSKVELLSDEIYEMNELGFFDVYLHVEWSEETFLKRMEFKLENDIDIEDKINLRSINFYRTKNGNLSFRYLEIIKPEVNEGDYKLTAVVLVYNGEPFLKMCLASLVNQSLDNLEILLINDASTDNSLEICKDFESKYPNVSLIDKEENKGLVDSVNLGMDHAKGEYVTFVDNDDIIPEYAYEKLYDKAKESDADISVGRANYLVNYQSKMSFIDDFPWMKERVISDIRDFPELFYDAFYWNKIFKKDFLMENGIRMMPEIKIYADICFVHKAYCHAHKISIIPDCVYLWRKRLDSLSRTRYDMDNFNDRMNAYEYNLEYVSQYYSGYFNTLFRRALIPVKGILESREFEELFFDRILKLFKKGEEKVGNIYDNHFTEIKNISSFLILNGYRDELKELLQLDFKNEFDILNENGKSYWRLPQFRNSNLNIPDELFEIRYLQEQFINIDEIIISDEYIFFNNIELPKYFEMTKGQIVFKGRAKADDIYDDFCIVCDVEKINDDGKNLFNAKIPLSKFNIFELYSIDFRCENKFGYSRDIKLSDRFIKSIVNKNENITVYISKNNHLAVIIQKLKNVFDIICNDESLIFRVNDSDRVKKNFMIYSMNNNTDKKLFFDFDGSKNEYNVKWKFFLEKGMDYDIFMRTYSDEGKLSEIIKIKQDFIRNFNEDILNKEVGFKVYATQNGYIKFCSF